MRKRISIVIPAHNETENIGSVYLAIAEVFAQLPYDLEVVFVNDGSTDRTQDAIERLASHDRRIRYVEFAGNFGQQAATAAGVSYATGDAAMIMDADLQHPPALIPSFVALWEEGHDAVFGVRRDRGSESMFRQITSRFAGIILNMRWRAGLPRDVSDFCLVDRALIDRFKLLPPTRAMTRFRLGSLGGKRTYITFDLAERPEGEGHYNVWRLTRMLLDTLTGFPVSQAYIVKNTNFQKT